MKLDDVIKG